MENNKNILPKVDENGQTELNFESTIDKADIKIEDKKDFIKENIADNQIILEDLSEEEMENLKENNPELYYELINERIKIEEADNNEKLLAPQQENSLFGHNELNDEDKDNPTWEYYDRFNKNK